MLDFQKLAVTVVKLCCSKQKLNTWTFQGYKRFRNDLFRSEIDFALSKLYVHSLEVWAFFLTSLRKFWITAHLWKRNFWEQARENSWPKNLIRQSWLYLDCVIYTWKRKVFIKKSHMISKEITMWICCVDQKK